MMRPRGGPKAGSRLRLLELGIELLDLRFERGNFRAQRTSAFGQGIGFLPEDWHSHSHLCGAKKNRRTPSAANATSASGQVKARPTRQSARKPSDSSDGPAGFSAAAESSSSSVGGPLSNAHFSRAAFHSMRALSMTVNARVSSTL